MSFRVALAAALVFPAGAGSATVDVDIRGSAYQPASVSVAVGDTVRWTNRDPVTHTVSSDTGAFESGDLALNQAYSFTFMAPGTYAYSCFWHPSMSGTVTVASGPGPPPPVPPPPPPEPSAPPELRIGDRRLREGDSGLRSAVFILRLSQASATTIRVGWRTARGTARRRSDYRARTRTLTIQPGETLKRLTVPTVGDPRDEKNETLWLVLQDPQGATIADSRGRGLIVDDD
jgi:plastocyanin